LEIEGRVLRSLGHTPWTLEQKFRKCVKAGDGSAALHNIRRLVRLQRTPQFPGQIAVHTGFHWSLRYEEDFLKQITQLDEALDILKLYVENEPGRHESTSVGRKLHDLNPELAARFDHFVLKLDRLHPDELGSYASFLHNNGKRHDVVEALYKRAIEADPKNANNLGNYANFLTDILKDYDAAEALYKRAIEADPKNANNLGNYANFLTDILKDYDAAEALYKRAIDADPKHANNLSNYAIFLKDTLKDYDAAETFYKRAIEADPKSAHKLGSYANFLTDFRKEHDSAEYFYKRAIDADPKHANNLGNYAIFLTKIRKDDETAEAYYKRSLELDSNSATKLGNYGQLLLGRGRIEEALKCLRCAWKYRDVAHVSDNAEVAYSLWLGTVLAEDEEEPWERVFNYFINVGFKRHVWTFDAMLAEAEKRLKSGDFKYAKALAEAFLDESKVPALEKFARWKKLRPLDPAQVNADGTIRKS
jgi:tetratricopeptide (TPR) repeat protein